MKVVFSCVHFRTTELDSCRLAPVAQNHVHSFWIIYVYIHTSSRISSLTTKPVSLAFHFFLISMHCRLIPKFIRLASGVSGSDLMLRQTLRNHMVKPFKSIPALQYIESACARSCSFILCLVTQIHAIEDLDIRAEFREFISD